VKGGVFTGGYEQDLLDTEIDLGILPLLRGLSAKSPYLLPYIQQEGAGEAAAQGGGAVGCQELG
jgi:hypothetical protein